MGVLENLWTIAALAATSAFWRPSLHRLPG
jgi:hypothetical protein